MQQWQLDRFVQKAEERFLLLRFAAKRLNFMAAHWAKVEYFAAPALEPMHAPVAHYLAAIGALMAHLRFMMAWAEK